MSAAKLSDKLYRWRGDDGGWQVGRKVADTLGCEVVSGISGWSVLMRCDFGRLYWVDYRDIEDHDTTYREQEKEAEGAKSQ